MPTSSYKLILEEGNEVERHLFYNAIGGKDACMTFKIYLNDINTGKTITDQVVKFVATLIYSESGQPVLKPNVFEIRDENQLIIDHNYPAIIKFRINEVSSHHQGQKFKLKVSPIVVDGDNNLEPVYSLPIEVRSKIVKSVRSRAAAEESNEVNTAHHNQPINKKVKHEIAPNNNNNNLSTNNGTSSIDILAQIASNASVPLLLSQQQQQHKSLSPTQSLTNNNMKEESSAATAIINPKQHHHQHANVKAAMILPSPPAIPLSHSPSSNSPTSTTSNSRPQLPKVVSMDYPSTTTSNNTRESSSSTLESAVASIIPITKSVKDHLMSVQIKDENSNETSFYYSLLQKTALFLNDMEILARMIQNDKDKERKEEIKKQQIQQQQELLLFQQQQQQLQQLQLVQLQKQQQQYEHQQQQSRLYPYNSTVESNYAYSESKYDDKPALSPTICTQTQLPFATSSTSFTFKPIMTANNNSSNDLKNMSKKQRAKELNKQQAWSGSSGNNNISSSGNSSMNSSQSSNSDSNNSINKVTNSAVISSSINLLPPPLLPSFYAADTKSKNSSPTTHFIANCGNSDNNSSAVSITKDDDDDVNKLTYQQSGVTDVCDDDCHTSSEDGDEDEEEGEERSSHSKEHSSYTKKSSLHFKENSVLLSSSSLSPSSAVFERQHSQPV